MGNPAGVKRDFDALEERRLQAAALLRKGLSQSEVARTLNVHRQSVSRWAAALESEGRRGLRKAGRAGRKPLLSAQEIRRIEAGLKRGPGALGYDSELWTSGRVAVLIEQECGIHYHPAHVWRILRRMGWSCQRPAGRAIERNEEAIQWWKTRRWPAIKKKPERRGERSSSSTRVD